MQKKPLELKDNNNLRRTLKLPVYIKYLRNALLLGAVCLAGLTACTQAKVVKYEAFQERTYPERSKPASYHNGSAQELLEGDYILIGFIDLRKNIQKCFDDNSCTQINDSPMSQADLAQEAAQRGGDIISLLEDRRILEKVQKKVCTGTTTTSYYIDGKMYTTTVCVSYATYDGFLEATISRALIWRYDPKSANAEVNFRAMQKAMQSLAHTYQVKVPQTQQEVAQAEEGHWQSMREWLSSEGPKKDKPPVEKERVSPNDIRVVQVLRQDSVAELEALMAEPWLPDWTDDKGRDAAMWAIMLGNQEAFSRLLRQGLVSVQRRDLGGHGVMSYATQASQLKILQKLRDHGGSLQERNGRGHGLVAQSCYQQQTDVLDWLLANGLKINQVNEQGVSALHLCVALNNNPMLRYLVQQGASIRALDAQGLSAMHYAAIRGDRRLIDQLRRWRLSTNATDQYGNTPLFFAAYNKNLPAWQALVAYGADAGHANEQGQLPLYLAFNKKHWAFIEQVLSEDERLHSLGQAGAEALRIAVQHKRAALTRLLLARGVRVTKDKAGNRIVYAAARYGDPRVLQALLEHKTDFNRRLNEGMTPLMIAAYFDNKAAVQVMLEQKVDSSVKDNRGMTALRHATLKGHESVVDMLRQAGVRE